MKCHYCNRPVKVEKPETLKDCKCRTIPIRVLEKIWSQMYGEKPDRTQLCIITDEINWIKNMLIDDAHKNWFQKFKQKIGLED